MTTISLNVNGLAVAAEVEPRTHLADFLREQRHLTGTHLGCEHGVCGACTLLIDGVPARSCITFAAACDGADVITIEGLDSDEIATELRAAFTREHALQCGYCTPGMIVAARDLVLRLADEDEARIRNAMSGNLCRCTGYVGIVGAIKSVLVARRARGISPMHGGGRVELGPVGSGHRSATQSPVSSQSRHTLAMSNTAASQQPTLKLGADWQPSATFERSFSIAQPREKVWAFFSDIEAVAACLPGVALEGRPADDNIRGSMRVKLGPISAIFQGLAQVTRNPADFSGIIEGSGQDPRSQSATRGRIGYRLLVDQDGASTTVDLTIGFALTGMLAQFGRSGLVQSLMDRIIADFVGNLTARLTGQPLPVSSQGGELKISSLLSAMLSDQFTALRRRLFGGKK